MPLRVETPLVIGLHDIVTHEKHGCEKNNGNCSHVCLPSSGILFVSVQTLDDMVMWQINSTIAMQASYIQLKHCYFDMSLHPPDAMLFVKENRIFYNILCDYFQICACPPGMMLSANNRTCTLQSACLADEVKCSEHDICIKRQQWCV